MELYCNQHNLQFHHRMTIYKSIIRSQIDYGIPIITYTKDDIDKLERDQCYALKRILRLNRSTYDSTMRTVLNIPSIKNRIDNLKIGFMYTLRNNKTNRCLAATVFNELWIRQQISCKEFHSLQPLAEAKKILENHNLNSLFSKNNDNRN